MKKTIMLSLLACALLFSASGAEAKKNMAVEDLDFGTYTCAAFLNDAATASSEDLGAIFLWLDGYLSGVSGDTVLKWKGLESFSEKLVGYCKANGKAKLLDAARKVGIE